MEAHCDKSGNPSRVKISEVIGHQIRVSLNGHAYWFADWSSRIHACGWSNKTNVELCSNSDIRGNVSVTKKAPSTNFKRHSHGFTIGK